MDRKISDKRHCGNGYAERDDLYDILTEDDIADERYGTSDYGRDRKKDKQTLLHASVFFECLL